MGGSFPELRRQKEKIEEILKREEESFNRTLDKGIALFEAEVARLAHQTKGDAKPPADRTAISAAFAFRLYDEQGFPLDLTQLMARERGLTVDTGRIRTPDGRAARTCPESAKEKRDRSDGGRDEHSPTSFLGYEHDHTGADVEAVIETGGRKGVILNNSVLYAEMGGQVGDEGEMMGQNGSWKIIETRKSGDSWIHLLADENAPSLGEHVTVRIDRTRRSAIERHHTVTHLLHWALHEVVSRDAVQKGSYVGPEKLTFDFSSAALTKPQLREVEQLVNEKIAEDMPVSWTEIPYAEARLRPEIMQFFGDKYGDASSRRPDRRSAQRIERILDGTLRRHPCPRDRRDRIVSNPGRIGDCRRHPPDRSDRGECGWRMGACDRGRAGSRVRCLVEAQIRPATSAKIQDHQQRGDGRVDRRTHHPPDQVEEEVRAAEKKQAKTAEAELQKQAAEIARALLEPTSQSSGGCCRVDRRTARSCREWPKR